MTRFQRLALAGAVFALSFIFFYEARGTALFSRAEPAAQASIFRENIALGAVALGLGSILLVALHRMRRGEDLAWWELWVFALGVGLLLGTAINSWLQVREHLY